MDEDDDRWLEELGLPPDDGSTNLFVFLELNAQAEASAAAGRFQLVHAIRREWERKRQGDGDPNRMWFRSLRAELATRLSVSEATMESMLGVAKILVEDLPETLASLNRGQFSERHARIIVDLGAGLSRDDMAEFERRVLPWAGELTPALFRTKARMIRQQVAAEDAEQEHREALLDRNVWAEHASAGMATMFVHLSAEDVHAIVNRVDLIARGLAAGPDETRTLAQLRADVLRDLLLDMGAVLPPAEGEKVLREPTLHRGIVPTVHLVVPVLSAMGQSDQPAHLEGYGPIDPETARRLAGAASGFYRILTDPGTGAVISYGRERYAVPKKMRRALQVRDGTCRFPGCNRKARFCDIDHTRDWILGGETAECNLACVCKGHHLLKHQTGWQVEQAPDGSGVMRWTSPQKRQHLTYPQLQVGLGAVGQTAWLDDTPAPF